MRGPAQGIDKRPPFLLNPARMARKSRIEYAGAIYQMMTRSERQEPVFEVMKTAVGSWTRWGADCAEGAEEILPPIEPSPFRIRE
jgi:hypothetical protein